MARAVAACALLALASVAAEPAALAAGRDRSADKSCKLPSSPPTVADVAYRILPKVTLRLDVYEPAGRGSHPALVIVHGGGWKSGCKSDVSSEAARAARVGFVVFAIDYRLACDPADPRGIDPSLCGYTGRAPVADVLAAVSWVRANGRSYAAIPTRIAALGFSSGGNLVYMAGATGVAGGSAPDAEAGWSGSTELGFLRSGAVTCSRSEDPPACTATRTTHIGCELATCPASWADDSAYAVEAGGTPAFVANSTDELIPYAEATDFAGELSALGVPHRLCTVAGSVHATGYEDLSCQGSSSSVFDATMTFLLRHLS